MVFGGAGFAAVSGSFFIFLATATKPQKKNKKTLIFFSYAPPAGLLRLWHSPWSCAEKNTHAHTSYAIHFFSAATLCYGVYFLRHEVYFESNFVKAAKKNITIAPQTSRRGVGALFIRKKENHYYLSVCRKRKKTINFKRKKSRKKKKRYFAASPFTKP